MYLILRKVGTSDVYNYCYRYANLAEAQAKYQELLQTTPPSKLKFNSTSAHQFLMRIDEKGSVSFTGFDFPIATTEQPGLIQLATIIQADYINPIDMIDGIPVTVQPSLVKSMIDAGLLYETQYNPYVHNVHDALNDLYNNINYIPIHITEFKSTSGLIFRKGSSNVIHFEWDSNVAPQSQQINDIVIPNEIKYYNFTNVSEDTDYTLILTDGKTSSEETLSAKFYDVVRWGSASDPTTYTRNFILGLSDSDLLPSNKSRYDIDVLSNQYGFLAVPSSFDVPSQCYIASVKTDLINCGTVDDMYGSYRVTYQIYRTSQSGLGKISIVFKE